MIHKSTLGWGEGVSRRKFTHFFQKHCDDVMCPQCFVQDCSFRVQVTILRYSDVEEKRQLYFVDVSTYTRYRALFATLFTEDPANLNTAK